MSSSADTLAHVTVFTALTLSDIAALVPRFREDRFEPEAYIFHEGDPATRLWIVKDGQVRIVKHGEGGREIVVEVIPTGEVFGGATMLMPAQPATAQAMSAVTTLSLSVDEYKRLLQTYPAVSVRVIEILGGRMQGFIRMRAMAGERVERRIAHILLKLANKFGEETQAGCVIRASLTRQDIAELADTTVETAIRVMSRFRKGGLVKTMRGGYICILDRPALAQITGGGPE